MNVKFENFNQIAKEVMLKGQRKLKSQEINQR
jgi:hypothetical protein